MRRTQSSRRASMPTSSLGEQRASSGRVTAKQRASTGGSEFELPRIPLANGGTKFWAIDEDSMSTGAELQNHEQAAPPRAKKERNTSARSNASNVSSAASAASRARLEKPKAWGGLHPKDFSRAHRQARASDKQRGMAGEPTVEEAISAMERREAIEHEAALAHLERLRLEAIEAERRETEERHRRLSEDIRQSFEARRKQNSERLNRQLASASFVPTKQTHGGDEDQEEWDVEEEDWDRDGHGHGRGHVAVGGQRGMRQSGGGGGVGDEFAYDANFTKAKARAGMRLPSVVHPTAKRHRLRSKAGGAESKFATTSQRGGAAEEEKKDMDVKLAELDDFDTRVIYFHTTTLKQRLEARGWGGDSGGGDTSPEASVKAVEAQRPPTVLRSLGYSDRFA